jgi:ABC-type iron transport system FetAB ATPase subunit
MIIDAQNLTLSYGNLMLTENLSFQISSGQKVCIAGRSGSGKTSLLKSLLGLVIPAKGTISIGGEAMDDKSVWHLRNKIAYVCQEPDMGHETVAERIAQPFGYKVNAHIDHGATRILEYFERFQLPEKLLGQQTTELSGGQKQRIAIIIALMLNRPILLLDEPVSAMDAHNKQAMKEMLAADQDRTVLFISHDAILLDIADTTIDLSDARGGK